jgi:hypothetical protein
MRYAINIVVGRPIVCFIHTFTEKSNNSKRQPLRDATNKCIVENSDNMKPNNDIIYNLTNNSVFPLLIAFKSNHYIPVLRNCLLKSSFRKPEHDSTNGSVGQLRINQILPTSQAFIDRVDFKGDAWHTSAQLHNIKLSIYVNHFLLEPTPSQLFSALEKAQDYLRDLIATVSFCVYVLI